MGNISERINHERIKSDTATAKLAERKIEVLQLRRKMIIMGMSDFQEALRKSTMSDPPEGETRIRVK
jgi:hypothetical protein